MVITVSSNGTEKAGVVDDNVIQPFRLEKSNIRGRMVRLGSVLENMLMKHNYPPPVSALLRELTTLGALLASMLKYEGIFSLQVKGDGAITDLVMDITHDGKLRAWANFDEPAVKTWGRRRVDHENNYFHMLGKGYIAFTVDQGGDMERYQGIVELAGNSLAESVQNYFNLSEQIKTSIKMATHPQDSQWRAGGIMIQEMPEMDAGRKIEEDVFGFDEDSWNRNKILLSTCTDDELLSPNLHSADILFRLFNEDGVRIYPATPVNHSCRCSLDKVTSVIQILPKSEIDEICAENNGLEIVCKFCGHEYSLNKTEIKTLLEE